MKKILIVLFVSAIVPYIAYSQTFSEHQKAITLKQLDSVFNEALRAGEKLAIDKIENSVNDIHKTGHIANGKFYATFDTIMISLRNSAESVQHQKYDIQNKTITVLSENTGIVVASGIAVVQLQSGNSIRAPFAWTFVYEKINGEWKVVHSNQSTLR
jgi:hypothetical protein